MKKNTNSENQRIKSRQGTERDTEKKSEGTEKLSGNKKLS